MMENKCNKTPNNMSKNSNKFLDHVYCSSETKNIRTANNNNNASGGGGGGGAGADLLALLKENKKLKTMLILHLDLIQEQSDQLISKDKQLSGVNEEVDLLRARNVQLEAQVEELQKQLQRQIKRAASNAGELCTLPPPPLAKIQCKGDAMTASGGKLMAKGKDTDAKTTSSSKSGSKAMASTNIIGECNGKLISKIILHRIAMPGRRREIGSEELHSQNSSSASESTSDADDSTQKSRQDLDYEEEELDEEEEEEDEDDEDVEDEDEDLVEEASSNGTEDSNDVYNEHSKRKRQRKTATLVAGVGRGAKPRQAVALTSPHSTSTSAAITTVTTTTAVGSKTITMPMKVCITPPTPSRGKQMPLMMWHAPEPHETDESGSCDSMADNDKMSQTATSPTDAPPNVEDSMNSGRDITNASTSKKSNQSSNLAPPVTQGPQLHAKSRRCAYISTQQLYCTREWEDEEFICDYEFIKEEAEALHADTPNLEIPKWTEHELTVSYSIEGTEDLCDDTFLKRHAKFETDEKRRKKWDVQQIREQRRIEKLKRRHCKDELQLAPEPQPLLSFYPQPDTIQTICYVNDLPVQAFGEIIPKLHIGDADFALPWLSEVSANASTSIATTNTTTNTSHYKPVVALANATTLNAVAQAGTGSTAVAGVGSGGGNTQAQLQQLNSSFVFLKKRRRQQSSSMITTATTARQRSLAAAKVSTSNANTNASPARL